MLFSVNICFSQDAATKVIPELKISPARVNASAKTAMILASTLAGQRIVAVGERGTVLLSDDAGKTFRQAKQVPISATLTSVYFTDQKMAGLLVIGGQF